MIITVKYNWEDIGAQIRKLRRENNLSQEQQIEVVPMSVTHLGNIENGKTNFSVDILIKFCEQYNVTPDYIMCGGNNATDDGFFEAVLDKLRLCDEKDRTLIMSIINAFVDRNCRRNESEE